MAPGYTAPGDKPAFGCNPRPFADVPEAVAATTRGPGRPAPPASIRNRAAVAGSRPGTASPRPVTPGKPGRLRRPQNCAPPSGSVTTPVHQLDDGAWVSVGDRRVVRVGDLWRVSGSFCGCEPTDLLAEGFVEVGVDGRTVEGRVAGQCVGCGASGVTGWLALGRLEQPSGRFRSVAADAVRSTRGGRR